MAEPGPLIVPPIGIGLRDPPMFRAFMKAVPFVFGEGPRFAVITEKISLNTFNGISTERLMSCYRKY